MSRLKSSRKRTQAEMVRLRTFDNLIDWMDLHYSTFLTYNLKEFQNRFFARRHARDYTRRRLRKEVCFLEKSFSTGQSRSFRSASSTACARKKNQKKHGMIANIFWFFLMFENEDEVSRRKRRNVSLKLLTILLIFYKKSQILPEVFFSGAGGWRSAPKRPRLPGRNGNTGKGKGRG